jgi:uncharacterized membrane protein YhaH (DUF805 family)
MSVSQLLFSFQGRLNRKPYWMTAIAITALMITLIVIAIVFFAEREVWVGIAVVALIALLYIPLIWVGLAVGAKRLHDRDRSAWWLLLFYAVPSILSSAADRIEGGGILLHLVASPSPSGPSWSSAACAARSDPTATAPTRCPRRPCRAADILDIDAGGRRPLKRPR